MPHRNIELLIAAAEKLGPILDELVFVGGCTTGLLITDEAGPQGPPNFTGAFVGMCCQDTAGTGYPADFDYFEYREREFSASPLP